MAATGNQQIAGTTNQQNQFSGGQLNLQNLLPSLYSSFLQGNIPSSFTSPSAPFAAYNSNFQNYVAPGLAAQYGAGSPQIGAQQAMGNQQLAGNLYQQGVSNYGNALSNAGGYGLTPTGYNTQQAGTGTTNQYGQGAGQTTTSSSILGQLLQGYIASLFP